MLPKQEREAFAHLEFAQPGEFAQPEFRLKRWMGITPREPPQFRFAPLRCFAPLRFQAVLALKDRKVFASQVTQWRFVLQHCCHAGQPSRRRLSWYRTRWQFQKDFPRMKPEVRRPIELSRLAPRQPFQQQTR